MIFGVALCLVLLPSTLAQCDCTQGSIGLDLTLLVDIDSASLANQQPNGLQPLDFVKNFLKQLLFNYGMDISSNDMTGVRVAVFGVNATGAFATKSTLYTSAQDSTPTTVRTAIENLSPDLSSTPSVDIDSCSTANFSGFLQAQNLYNKNTLGQRQNIPNVVITIASSTTSTAALYDSKVLQGRFGTLMIGIAVTLSGSNLDYTDISSPNAAFQVTKLSPNGFDDLMNPILGLLCTAEGYCGGAGNSTSFPPTASTPNPGAATQHSKCHNGSDAYPKLWLDVVLLIDNSAAQTELNFHAMIEQIKEIWQPDQGGPIVSQGTGRTRVSVITFDTVARVIVNLDELNSNADLMDVLSNITQTSAVTVDGSNALQMAGSRFGPNARGDRQNAPNVIIIYTADWAGNDPCQNAESIQQHSVVLAVTVKNRNSNTPSLQKCVYSPGELYQSSNLDLDIITLESLAFANCFCIGQNMPGNHGGSMRQKTSRADHQVWYQFWNARDDKSYYLRDKWAECVQETTSISSNHDTSLKSCHDDQNFLPNEFNDPKHQFLLRIAQVGSLLTQWVGLQYDPNVGQWFWDGFDPISNQPTRTPMSPADYTNWNPGQPDTSKNQYCVKESPGTIGAHGFKWYTVQCTGFQLLYHSQYLCQRQACDAFNYCSDY